MNYTQLSKIQSVINSAISENELAGMNVLIHKDGKEIAYFQGGKADIENNLPYSRDTICRMYSMTKTITSVASMILLQEGKIDLADEVSKYLPSFKNLQVCTEKGRNRKPHSATRQLLVQDLLNMTSGYSYGAWSEDAPLGEHLTSDLLNELNADVIGENKITTQDVANRLAQIPVNFEPGTDYNYGLSADIMGALIEKVAECKYSDFLKEKIFAPLGMIDTDFYVPQEKQHRLSKVYKTIEDFDKTGIAKKRLELFTNCNLGIQDKMDRAPSFESGGAGLCSTIDDYMKFANMLVNGGELEGKRILQPKTVDFMTKCHLSEHLQQCFNNKMQHLSGYTYCNFMRIAFEPGRCKYLTEKEEFGWDGWLGPYLSIDRKNNLTFVVTMQRCDSGTISTTRRIKNIIYSALK